MSLLEFTIMKQLVSERIIQLHKLYMQKYNPMKGQSLDGVFTFLKTYQMAVEGDRITAISLVSYMELGNKHWKYLKGLK